MVHPAAPVKSTTQPPLRIPSPPPSGQPEPIEGHGPIERIGSTVLPVVTACALLFEVLDLYRITGSHFLQDLQLVLLGT